MKKILILLIGFLVSCDYPESPIENYSGCIITHTWISIKDGSTINVIGKKRDSTNWVYVKFNTFKSEFKYSINDTIK